METDKNGGDSRRPTLRRVSKPRHRIVVIHFSLPSITGMTATVTATVFFSVSGRPHCPIKSRATA